MSKIDSTPVSLLSAADLSAKKFFFGKLTATGVDACSVLGERADGVIGAYQKALPAAGDAVDFYLDRIVLVQSSAAIVKGAALTPAATGKAVTAAIGNIVRAKALDAATAADQWIRALIVSTYAQP
ncbi:MAG: DUF2190 family protein [Thermoleophilaceae bacterium]|nr:DUF2190 family protein [Thermoleophilaceae bacterium]